LEFLDILHNVVGSVRSDRIRFMVQIQPSSDRGHQVCYGLGGFFRGLSLAQLPPMVVLFAVLGRNVFGASNRLASALALAAPIMAAWDVYKVRL
jgi:hypothetical protein